MRLFGWCYIDCYFLVWHNRVEFKWWNALRISVWDGIGIGIVIYIYYFRISHRFVWPWGNLPMRSKLVTFDMAGLAGLAAMFWLGMAPAYHSIHSRHACNIELPRAVFLRKQARAQGELLCINSERKVKILLQQQGMWSSCKGKYVYSAANYLGVPFFSGQRWCR